METFYLSPSHYHRAAMSMFGYEEPGAVFRVAYEVSDPGLVSIEVYELRGTRAEPTREQNAVLLAASTETLRRLGEAKSQAFQVKATFVKGA